MDNLLIALLFFIPSETLDLKAVRCSKFQEEKGHIVVLSLAGLKEGGLAAMKADMKKTTEIFVNL